MFWKRTCPPQANMVAFYRQFVCEMDTSSACPHAVIFIFRCHLVCVMGAGSACCRSRALPFAHNSKKFVLLNLYFDKRKSSVAHAATEHLLLSIASKVEQKRICSEDFRRLAKTVSSNLRKVSFVLNARRRQFESFILSPSAYKRFSVCHIFSLAVGLDV